MIEYEISVNRYWHLGDYPKVIQCLREALVKYPDSVEFHMKLGHFLNEVEDLNGAIEAYSNALALTPNDRMVQRAFWRTLRAAGRHQEALAHLETWISRSSLDADLQGLLGRHYLDVGENQAALEAYRRATALDPTVYGYWFNLGGCLVDEGELTEAIKSYQQAMRVEPEWTSPLVELGRVYEQLGHLIEAREVLTQWLEHHDNHPESAEEGPPEETTEYEVLGALERLSRKAGDEASAKEWKNRINLLVERA
jgi:tetratricopeptide (TPR) repeat protein